ncbi:hypothetical protein KC327_g7284 [Hortaea werneckii]|uniref:RING-type E3 ubiquitin transferase n=2 Tax=Hortaea werneckii TaxID=91943 RepID=A0A3M7IZA6_HORWE|nr:hypothetical protein KC350_g10231 [Hortaea werneckii]OTA25703.1 hypothetical protein BTJ68_11134 [Hortaea werneckii EXF-2000]KAI6827423.1 hypothetical protein KC358_g7492 [Hortaea werneckii]KAI6927142.1 hypothetical protein KC348_g8476 [Hortaea werneckii]KAI6934801.1 hypothetical protein KC341_g7376 [Hortaea werneckii]
MRLAYYAGASTAAAAAALLKAFHQRPNFYSATVYLAQSNACLLILTNLCLVAACSLMYGLQRLLYGRLRPIEIEQLSEKAWYAVLDTLLAMPSFREEVGGWLLTMFVLLLAGKVWGWIGEGRVDILEQQPPANPRLFHFRLATSLLLSVAFDLWMLSYCVETVMANPKPGMMVIFTFEFAVLGVFSTFTLARYCLAVIQTRLEKKQMEEAIEARKIEIRAERAAARQNETDDGTPLPASAPDDEPIEVDENEVDIPGWEDKRKYLFALEVFTDFVKMMIYLVFFTVSITFNGLPMHIMRDVYMTFASFSKRVSDYMAYRKATSDMNTRYPDATTEEIRGDACIVCREGMVAWEQPTAAANGQAQPDGQPPAPAPAPQRRRDEGLRAKKLPCGHILHLRCLKAWLERQQVCPTCRRPVVTQPEAGQPGQQGQPGQVNVPRVPGMPGAPGAGGVGQQRPAAQNRARIFNLGPIRIGFLNGPGDQIQNIVNQMRNPQAAQDAAAGQGDAALPGAAQQGPNHLGLQVPYATGTAGQPGVAGLRGRSPVSTQVQMLQLEQRLMHDAHNLGIEQQQLATLRMMEAELARLRAGHLPAHQPVGTQSAAQRQQLGIQQGIPGFNVPFGSVPEYPLSGSHQQTMMSGNENLPQGLVLPEGWSLLPLRRQNLGTISPQGAYQVPQQQQSSQPPIQTTTNGPTAGPTAQQPTSEPPRELQQQTQTSGPTDDRGSPLFVPAQQDQTHNVSTEGPTTTTNPLATATPLPETQPAVQPSTGSPAAPPSQASVEQASSSTQPETEQIASAPWTSNSDNGWSFVDQPADSLSANEPQAHPVAAETTDQSQTGKGKGRAVEVEDVPDEDDNS